MGHIRVVTSETDDAGPTPLDPATVTRASQALAACVFAPVVLAVLGGLLPSVPAGAVGPVGPTVADALRGVPVGVVYAEVLPVALAAAVVVRATVTRRATDAVLAALTAPCLLAVVYAVYARLFTDPGVYWGHVFTLGAAILLASAVLVEAAIAWRFSAPLPERGDDKTMD